MIIIITISSLIIDYCAAKGMGGQPMASHAPSDSRVKKKGAVKKLGKVTKCPNVKNIKISKVLGTSGDETRIESSFSKQNR